MVWTTVRTQAQCVTVSQVVTNQLHSTQHAYEGHLAIFAVYSSFRLVANQTAQLDTTSRVLQIVLVPYAPNRTNQMYSKKGTRPNKKHVVRTVVALFATLVGHVIWSYVCICGYGPRNGTVGSDPTTKGPVLSSGLRNHLSQGKHMAPYCSHLHAFYTDMKAATTVQSTVRPLPG